MNKSILHFQLKNTISYKNDFEIKLLLQDNNNSKEYDRIKNLPQNLLINTFDELSSDIFYSFYNKKVELLQAEYVQLKFLLNHLIMDNFIKQDDYKKFREGQYKTIYNDEASFEAVLISIQKIIKYLDRYLSDDSKNEINDVSDEINQIDKKENHLNELKKKGQLSGLDQKEFEKLNQEIIKSKLALKNKIQEISSTLKGTIAQSIQKGLSEAKSDIDDSKKELQKVLGGFNQGFEQGELQKLPIHKRIELAKLLSSNKKIMEIAEILGRFNIIAEQKQIEKKSNLKIEVSDITKGNDLEKVTPDEFSNLSNPHTRDDFNVRWASGELLTFERKPETDKENIGKGSVIICVDTSGSMAGIKELKAKGLALSVAQITYQQKRNFACILFSSSHNNLIVDIISQSDSPASIAEKVINIATSFIGGGTDFESPLNKAISIIEQDEFNNADILFLTDGYANISEPFLSKYNDLKGKKKFKTIGLLVDANDADRYSVRDVMHKFCDDIKYNQDIEKDLDFSQADEFVNDIFLKI